MTPNGRGSRLKGGPLIMLALLLTGWSAARAVWWENPFAVLAPDLGLPRELAIANLPGSLDPFSAAADTAQATSVTGEELVDAGPTDAGAAAAPLPLPFVALGGRTGQRRASGRDHRLAAAPEFPGNAALPASDGAVLALGVPGSAGDGEPPLRSDPPPFLPVPPREQAALTTRRWSVDAWAFWRQGSDAAPISQGRVPIYGASQAGAVLHYRLAPASAHDPRLYARAYRALVRRGESELALGAAGRPIARVPLRAAAEVRYTDAAFSDTWRPAAFVVTELAPVMLPYGAQLEAYGQAGWVGGQDPTGFADGQASVTGEVRPIAGLSDNRLRLSVGVAAWGGAQQDAQRIDVGPTLRLDLDVGDVPARISIDWRERVGGDAGPDSGLAATLSTRF